MKVLAKIIFNLITLGSIGFAIYAYFNPILWVYHFTGSDALLHVIGFAIVSCLLSFMLPKVKRSYLIFWLCSVGGLIEVAQPLLTPRRELSISDIGANALGVLIGVVISSGVIYGISQLKKVMKKKPGSAAL